MTSQFKYASLLLIGFLFLASPVDLQAMTAKEILDRVAKESLGDTFRIALTAKTFKGKKLVSNNVIWLMGKASPDFATFFLEFDEPEESKGLRFLIEVQPEKDPKAFMFLPATGKTVSLAVDDPSADVGGTGLSAEDIHGFVPKKGEVATVVGDEVVDGRDCYKISIQGPEGKGVRDVWVSKKDFLITKSQQVDGKGKVIRTFTVVKFFKTEKGKEFPRQEVITIPGKDTRIEVTQDHAVFGVALPEEVMDPEQFGTFTWRQ